MNKLLIFERQKPVLDHFIGETDKWEEVCKAWCKLEPAQIYAQRFEFADSGKTTSTRKSVLTVHYTPTTATIRTDCRAKLARDVAVNETNATADENYRMFHVEQIVNVGEQNRKLQMLVQELT